MYMLSMKHRIRVNTDAYTNSYTKVIDGFGGRLSLITGIKATKPIIRAAKLAIRSANPGSVKYKQMLVRLNRNTGTKIVKAGEIGIL